MIIGKHLHIVCLLTCGLLGMWPAVVVSEEAAISSDLFEPRTWAWDLTSGFDTYRHTYALATVDTTESLSDFMFQAGLSGQSSYRARHRWRVRAEASAGSELFRERLTADYRYMSDHKRERARLMGSFRGRQYRDESEYSRSSDNWESRIEGRFAPWYGSVMRLELRGWGNRTDYRRPSELEVDHHESGAGAFLRSNAAGSMFWNLGVRAGQRSYPDSTAINRETLSVEGDLDHRSETGRTVRLYHKSERRLIADESARPSASTHWTDFSGSMGVGGGQVVVDLQSEHWRYDVETDVYFNSSRIEGLAGFRWGDILTAGWKIGLAAEHLAAGDSPETYSQIGLRGALESYGSALGGSLTLEYGRRMYAQGNVELEVTDSASTEPEYVLLYSDFNYWQVWLTASWRISDKIDLDVLANYEPESHTEKSDDSALGFASLRIRWRP